MKATEIFALLPFVAQLLTLFGGKKTKKKARALYPMILEAIQLWPKVAPKLEAAAAGDPDVARFRAIVDEVVKEF